MYEYRKYFIEGKLVSPSAQSVPVILDICPTILHKRAVVSPSTDKSSELSIYCDCATNLQGATEPVESPATYHSSLLLVVRVPRIGGNITE